MDAKTAEMGVRPAVPPAAAAVPPAAAGGPVVPVLVAVSVCHCLNDLIQSLVPAIYPILKAGYGLDFGQIGLITLAFQITASLLQPLIGVYTDRRPVPFSLPFGMGLTLAGVLLLSFAGSYGAILVAAALIGSGSSVFHPESSRVARMASGGRHGTAQSVFQVGGNLGQALGPLMAAFVVVPRGQGSVAWFSLAALLGIVILTGVGRWYRARLALPAPRRAARAGGRVLSRRRVGVAVAILILLVFSKNVYTAGLTSYHTFYLIQRFGLPVQAAQLALFVFLGAIALGTVMGGPLSDRFGGRAVIWVSVAAVLPFTLALPHLDLGWTIALTVPIGLLMGAASPQILVFAQDLVPGRVGLVSGLFFGLAFGLGGLGAALLGEIADHSSIEFVYGICAWLPAFGLAAFFLPDLRRLAPPGASTASPDP